MSDEFEPKKKRNWWKWLLGCAALVGGGLFVYVATVRSSLNRLTTELDQTDPGWRLEEIEAARRTYSPDTNAAARIVTLKSLPRMQGPQYVRLHDVIQTATFPEKQLDSRQIEAINTLLDSSKEAVTEARKLIETPNGRHVIVWSPDWISTILKCQDNREAASLLKHEALRCAQNGDADGALKATHAGFHCGTSIGDEPMMISQLVRIACQAVALGTLERVLAQGSPSDDLLAAFQKRLEESEAEPLLLYAFRGERGGQYQLLEFMRSGNVPNGLLGATAAAAGGGPPAFDPMSLLMRLPGFMTSQSIACIRHMNDMVAIARTPPEEWAPKFVLAKQQAANLPILAKMLAPATDKFSQAVQRSHAQQRCAFTAIAFERFRKKHDRWPESLDELKSSGLLKSIPIDPYVGGPLKVKRLADGILIYATGPDLKDDGGVYDRANPVKAGTDFGFQLWDVASRRQPAPPPKPPEDESPPADAPAPPGTPK